MVRVYLSRIPRLLVSASLPITFILPPLLPPFLPPLLPPHKGEGRVGAESEGRRGRRGRARSVPVNGADSPSMGKINRKVLRQRRIRFGRKSSNAKVQN